MLGLEMHHSPQGLGKWWGPQFLRMLALPAKKKHVYLEQSLPTRSGKKRGASENGYLCFKSLGTSVCTPYTELAAFITRRCGNQVADPQMCRPLPQP